jgi:hypothetical protein
MVNSMGMPLRGLIQSSAGHRYCILYTDEEMDGVFAAEEHAAVSGDIAWMNALEVSAWCWRDGYCY